MAAVSSTIELREEQGIRLAIEGCGHGTLHAIYASIEQACKVKGWPGIDLLLIGGDFQSVRNAYDLNCVAMPAKYREMCDFHEYYSGARTAPYLTVFVGGNHEASNYLFELYYGGWVSKNIYYMGAANILRLGPLRISGLSGIWKGYSYKKPHYERLPYNESDLKSIYHVREIDTRKLLQVRTQVDVCMSHDWPRGVEWKGDWKKLFARKSHFEEDARNGQLGSVAAKLVMDRLRPKWWFSAHLHCKFAGIVEHGEESAEPQAAPAKIAPAPPVPPKASAANNAEEVELDLDDDMNDEPAAPTNGKASVVNADELDLELEDDVDGVAPVAPGQGLDGAQVPVDSSKPGRGTQSAAKGEFDLDAARAALPESFRRPTTDETPIEHPTDITNKTTHFLALDKCLPHRHFLQLMDIPISTDVESQRPLHLSYDKEWLAITRAFAIHEPLILGDPKFNAPRAKSESEYLTLISEQKAWIDQNLADADLAVPENFEVTAPVYDGGDFRMPHYSQEAGGLREYTNSQTVKFCELLKISNPFDVSEEVRMARMQAGPLPDPESERFNSGGRGRGGRGGSGSGRGRGRGGGGGGGRGRGRGRGGWRG